MKFKIIDDLAIFLGNIVPEKYLSRFQEFLLSGAIFTDANKVLAMLIIFMLISEFTLAITVTMFRFPVSVFILPLFVIPGLFTYVIVQQERKVQEIEKTAPDFLRQLSSMLQVGLSFENAMEDMSQYGEGPLYDEIRRTIIEIRMVSTVLFDVSQDLRDLMALKRERKSMVMMSVMFLLISAVIATPFAVGMVGVYSGFMQGYGMESEIVLTAPLAGEIYLIIHSVLVGFIISLIMYGEIRKGIKFSLPLAAASFGIFYFISTFGSSLLIGGF